MDVSENSGFSPQIIHLNMVFHYKPSILGYLFLETPKCNQRLADRFDSELGQPEEVVSRKTLR